MEGFASVTHALKRAYPFLVAGALVALYSQLQESRDELAKMRSSMAQLDALNTQLEQRIARVASQRLEPQASPFGTGPVSVAEKNEPPQRLSPVERKEALIEEQRANDRARYEQSQERAEQRQAGTALPPGAQTDAPRQGPLANLMAKARRTP